MTNSTQTPSFDTTQIVRMKRVPAALRDAGLEVPKSLNEAVHFANIQPSYSSVQAARNKLASCSAKELDSVMAELANAYAVEMIAQHHPGFQAELERAKMNRLLDALQENEAELYTSLITAFNEHAERFTDAAHRLPDMAAGDAWNLTDDQFDALRTARGTAAAMRPLWDAYLVLSGALGYADPTGKDPADYYAKIYMLSDPKDFGSVSRIAERWFSYDKNLDGAKAYKAIAPFAQVVFGGATLRLKHPNEARALRAEQQGS